MALAGNEELVISEIDTVFTTSRPAMQEGCGGDPPVGALGQGGVQEGVCKGEGPGWGITMACMGRGHAQGKETCKRAGAHRSSQSSKNWFATAWGR